MLFFLLFSGFLFLTAYLVISCVNPVNSVLFLILAFICSACVLFFLHLEFIPFIFIIVYVGAIAVLFLFIVMMLNIKIVSAYPDFFKYFSLGSLIGMFFFICIFSCLNNCLILPLNITFSYQPQNWLLNIDKITNLNSLGQNLYTDYFVFFLISGVILLVAMIGTIILTHEFNKQAKIQYLFRQLSRNAEKAVFLTSSINHIK